MMILVKAGFNACLFLLTGTCVFGQQWVFDPSTKLEYERVLDLRPRQGTVLSNVEGTAGDIYVASLAETLELLLTEDQGKFSSYEDRFEKRLARKIGGSAEDLQFLKAEMHLHWAFVYLKFGHEFDAGSHLHEAYKIAQKCKRKYPRYTAIRKTTGLLEVMIGSVPEKYNWLLSVLGMKGSVAKGLQDLAAVESSASALAFEASLLHALVQGYILQKPEVGSSMLKKILESHPTNRTSLFLAGALSIKNAQSEEAFSLFEKIDTTAELPLHYVEYLRGEILLHKGEYDNAITRYQAFLRRYAGENFIKDAYYKIGLCHHLNGDAKSAMENFQLAKEKGKDAAEADRSAARSVNQIELPHIQLSKVRYSTDGGYYDQARKILSEITDRDLPEKRDQVEYYYRKARLEHKTLHLAPAKLFYTQTIEMSGEESWYFAPNSCLQLGYIFLEDKDAARAKAYFRKALSYRHHEYKNSIDAKAKSGLERLKSIR